MYLTIQLSNYPTIQISKYPNIQLSNYPTIQIFHYPSIELTNYQTICDYKLTLEDILKLSLSAYTSAIFIIRPI